MPRCSGGRPPTPNPRVARANSPLQERASLVSSPQAGRGKNGARRECFPGIAPRKREKGAGAFVAGDGAISKAVWGCICGSVAIAAHRGALPLLFHSHHAAALGKL